jgi:hypothetical protein
MKFEQFLEVWREGKCAAIKASDVIVTRNLKEFVEVNLHNSNTKKYTDVTEHQIRQFHLLTGRHDRAGMICTVWEGDSRLTSDERLKSMIAEDRNAEYRIWRTLRIFCNLIEQSCCWEGVCYSRKSRYFQTDKHPVILYIVLPFLCYSKHCAAVAWLYNCILIQESRTSDVLLFLWTFNCYGLYCVQPVDKKYVLYIFVNSRNSIL